MKSKIFLSIVVPVFNSDKYLKTIFKNILISKQKKFYEIIFIDDFSKDESLNLCKKFQLQNLDFNINIIKNLKNIGVGEVRNIGINNANGNYLLFIDSDDIIFKNNLNKLIINLKHKISIHSPDILFCNFIDIDFKVKNLYKSTHCKKKNFFLNLLIKKQEINYCFPYIYKNVFLSHNELYFNNFRYAEDFLFITKAFSMMKSYEKINLIIIKHIYNKNSLSSQINIENNSIYLAIIRSLEKFELSNLSKIGKLEKKYLIMRKKTCLEQFLFRSLAYKIDDIILYNKNIISKSGILKVKNNFFYKNKPINIIFLLMNITTKILRFLNTNNYTNTVVIYGYGVVGRAIHAFLKQNNFKKFIIFDDKVNKSHLIINKLKIHNFKKYSNIKLIQLSKLIICLPHHESISRLYFSLIKNISKKNIFKLTI